MSDHRSFMELALNGEVVADEVEEFVAAWHEGSSTVELHAFLGMTWDEYRLWASDPAYLSRDSFRR
jgi:hypothetical protein